MPIRREPRLVAAFTLAAVTLGVFAMLQNYGPESAVRRFHHGVVTNDPKEIEQVVTQSVNSSAVTELVNYVRGAMNAAGGYRVARVDRGGKQVDILTIYGDRAAVVWVVTLESGRWRIDPFYTLQGMRKLGFGPM